MTKARADAIPRYEQPMDEPERTPYEWMDLCKHCNACARLFETFIDSREYFGRSDDMARILKCDECDEWTEA